MKFIICLGEVYLNALKSVLNLFCGDLFLTDTDFLYLLVGMGTKVQCESYFPGYFSMRDLNEDSNSCSWPLYYNDKAFTNGQYYAGFINRSIADAYTSYDKDVLKQTMLEHEATFKKQVLSGFDYIP